MTRIELTKALYEAKKNNLPNVIGLNRPLTQKEFIKRYLNNFSKSDLEGLLKREMARA